MKDKQENFNEILDFCVSIAKYAGSYLNKNYGYAIPEEKMKNAPEGVDSATFNIVTDVDKNLQKNVARLLLDQYPNFEFFGEEDPDKVFDSNKDKELISKINNNKSRYQFIVDPLDGTGRYAKKDARHGFFLGLLEDNSFKIAISYNPKQDSLTYALKGKGCYRNGNKFMFDSSIDDHIVINSKADKNQGFKDALQGNFLMRPKHTGTMYDMLFNQYAQSMVSLKTNTHDHPLSLAVKEAGGSVLVYDGSKFVDGADFNWRKKESKKDANIPAYIAANNKENAEKLAKVTKKYL